MTQTTDDWVKQLNEAFDNWGTDENKVITVLTKAQKAMDSLINAYPNLEDRLYDELSGKELRDALRLYYVVDTEAELTPIEDKTVTTWVSDLHEAFYMLGTDENVVEYTFNQADISFAVCGLAGLYNKSHDTPLEDELFDELSGDDLRKVATIYYKHLPKKTFEEDTAQPENKKKTKVDVTVVPKLIYKGEKQQMEKDLEDLYSIKLKGRGREVNAETGEHWITPKRIPSPKNKGYETDDPAQVEKELHVLQTIFKEILNEQELKILKGYTFIRVNTLEGDDQEAGMHVADTTGKIKNIFLYNSAFQLSDSGFTNAISTTLHEIGHAIDFSNYFRVTDADKAICDSRIEKDEALDGKFLDLIKGKLPVTPRAKVSTKEAFAEEFVFFKTKPEDQKTKNLALYQWFSNNKHVDNRLN